MLLLLLLLPAIAKADTLPAKMLGTYQLETSKGFTDFMYEIGVNWFTRQIACSLYPKATNKNLPSGKIGIDTSSTFKSSSDQFNFGVAYDETTSDGRKVRTTATLVGDSLIKNQVGKGSSSSSVEVREFTQGGKKMSLIHTIPGKPKIRSVRVYKLLSRPSK